MRFRSRQESALIRVVEGGRVLYLNMYTQFLNKYKLPTLFSCSSSFRVSSDSRESGAVFRPSPKRESEETRKQENGGEGGI